MDNFSELIKEAIAEGDDLESAMRKAAAIAAKEAVESLFQTEVESLLGVLEGEAVPHDGPVGIDDAAFVLVFADVDSHVKFLCHSKMLLSN